MRYDISKTSAPKMPTLGSVTKKHPNPPLKGHKTPSVPPLVHQALAIAQKMDRLTNRQVMPAGRVKKKGLKK